MLKEFVTPAIIGNHLVAQSIDDSAMTIHAELKVPGGRQRQTARRDDKHARRRKRAEPMCPRIAYAGRSRLTFGNQCRLDQRISSDAQGSEKILDFITVAFSFVCGKYCSIID